MNRGCEKACADSDWRAEKMGDQKRSARAGAKARPPSIVSTGAAVADASSRCLPFLDGFSTKRLLKNYDHYLDSDSWWEGDSGIESSFFRLGLTSDCASGENLPGQFAGNAMLTRLHRWQRWTRLGILHHSLLCGLRPD